LVDTLDQKKLHIENYRLLSITSENVLMALLLIYSGNPFIRLFPKTSIFFVLAIILIIFYKSLDPFYFKKVILVFLGLLFLFFLQKINLGYLSWVGSLNFFTKIFFGSVIIYLLGHKLPFRFFIIVYYISLASLVLFAIINIGGFKPPGFVWGTGNLRVRTTYIIYSFLESHPLRNAGMFWEPGAFAGVIGLCLALNFNELSNLWNNHKWKLIIIIIALITTQSTTGYIVVFFIFVFHVIFQEKFKSILLVLIPIIGGVAYIIYTNTEFLKDKIEKQNENSVTIYENEFKNTRMGSLMFDLYYIKKNPLIGNGLHYSTRYADHPLLILTMDEGDDLGHGNGFSNYLACLGIPFMVIYLFAIFINLAKISFKFSFLVTFVVILTLQGEQWLDFPLYLGLPFLNLPKQLYSRGTLTKGYRKNNKALELYFHK
jgi:hypothetical protein